jgi:8-oxo-dGTP diphosphatase
MGDSTPERTRLVVGAVVVDDLDHPTRMLAARRSLPPDLAGGWELPGGKVEPGESPEQALHREIREELGVTIVLGGHVPGPNPDGTWPLGRQYRLHVRLATIECGQPRMLEDHDELRWLTATQLYAVPWLPADLPVVQALADRLHSIDSGTANP